MICGSYACGQLQHKKGKFISLFQKSCRLSFSMAGKGGQLLSVSPEVNWISSFLALASAQVLSSLGMRPVNAVILLT